MSTETTNILVPIAPQSLHRKERSVFKFKPENKTETAKPVYHALAEHQIQEESWEYQELAAWLQLWTKRFNEEFHLGLSEISLCIEWLSIHRLGHFRHGTNGFGLKGEIAINRRHFHSREPWQILGTLLHELVHAWQEIYGKPGKHNYHNKQFREKARDFGLIIDTKGRTQYEPNSCFFEVLKKYDVNTPTIPPVVYVTGQGKSKLKKWACQCDEPINVRVAVSHFYARCMWCGELFELRESGIVSLIKFYDAVFKELPVLACKPSKKVMSMKLLEKISLWFTLFSISFCIVYFFNSNLWGAVASGVTTASVKTPFLLAHNYLWSTLKR